MPRDDAFSDFRELLLLQRSPLPTLAVAGAAALAPLPLGGALALAVLGGHWGGSAALAGYGRLVGAAAAWGYRRGQLPYRRGDLGAAAAFIVGLTPVVIVASQFAGQALAPGVALMISILPSLALEVCWRPLFLFALRRMSGLHLDMLVHDAIREHYGDDWQAYTAHIRADLREARRLRELAEKASDGDKR